MIPQNTKSDFQKEGLKFKNSLNFLRYFCSITTAYKNSAVNLKYCQGQKININIIKTAHTVW